MICLKIFHTILFLQVLPRKSTFLSKIESKLNIVNTIRAQQFERLLERVAKTKKG